MKIIAVGWNYRGHNAEMNQKETPQNPIIFFKPETALPHFPIREKHSR